MLKRAIKPSLNFSRFYFSTIQVNNQSTPNLSEQSNHLINKILENDHNYFLSLTRKEGLESVLRSIYESTQNLDISTQNARNVIKSRDELITRITVQERSIEEHENITVHINEEDVYRTYNQHIKELEKNDAEVQKVLREKSNSSEKCIYRRGKSEFKFKHIISPSLIFGLPSYLVLENSLFLKLTFGLYSPTVFMSAFGYLGYLRYKSITKSSNLSRGNYIVESISLKNSRTLFITALNGLKTKDFDIELSHVSIELLENESGSNTSYIITDEISSTKFFVNLDETSFADRKALSFLANRKLSSNVSEDIKSIISDQNKLIDIEDEAKLRQSIDRLTRIKLLQEKNGDIGKFNEIELLERIYSIPDAEVKEYINKLGENESQNTLSLEQSSKEIVDFFLSLGISNEDGVLQTLVEVLRNDYFVNNINELKSLNGEKIRAVFNKVGHNFANKNQHAIDKFSTYFS